MFSAMIVAVAMTGQYPNAGFVTPAPQGQVVSQGYYAQSYSQSFAATRPMAAPYAPCGPAGCAAAPRAYAPAYAAPAASSGRFKFKFKMRGGRRCGSGGC